MDHPLGPLPIGDGIERVEVAGDGILLFDPLGLRQLCQQDAPPDFVLPQLQFHHEQPFARLRDLATELIQLFAEAVHGLLLEVELVKRRAGAKLVLRGSQFLSLGFQGRHVLFAGGDVLEDLLLGDFRLCEHVSQAGDELLVLTHDLRQDFLRLKAFPPQPRPTAFQVLPEPLRADGQQHQQERQPDQ